MYLPDKPGRYYTLEGPFYHQKEAFKKKGSAEQWLAFS